MHARRFIGGALAALLLSVSLQSIGFAGVASRGTIIQGHVRSFGSHHQIRQPAPIQAAPTLNVRDFGAVGDGVTDDTAAIQNCINAAQANREGVLFPAGTYLHTGVITANGIGLKGVGGASILLANNPTSSAVVLTGVSPSIQNLVINSQPAGSNTITFLNVPSSTLAVTGSQNFVVQGITIVQGTGRKGILLIQSAVGQVSSVTFNAGGDSALDYGVVMDSCSNVSLIGNLFLNEGFGIAVGASSFFVNQSIALIANTINSVARGIWVIGAVTLDIDQNQIQALANFDSCIILSSCNNYSVTRNNTWNGANAMNILPTAGTTGIISQNVMRNVGGIGANISSGGGVVQFVGNQFGECGFLSLTQAVILANPGLNPDSIVLLNNVYSGHANGLATYISSGGNHINLVSGNTQTQTTLPIVVP
ncbi:MAG: hypothetical protein C5B53_10580 [Candidatus Melainabacteria bacterium]|nr:MAG: hypothetical protein C5B53_10580 [Candidatus Melainabacteria bacterium]